MNNDLVMERGIPEHNCEYKVADRAGYPGRDQNGNLIATGWLLMPECDHADAISVVVAQDIEIRESPSV